MKPRAAWNLPSTLQLRKGTFHPSPTLGRREVAWVGWMASDRAGWPSVPLAKPEAVGKESPPWGTEKCGRKQLLLTKVDSRCPSFGQKRGNSLKKRYPPPKNGGWIFRREKQKSRTGKLFMFEKPAIFVGLPHFETWPISNLGCVFWLKKTQKQVETVALFVSRVYFGLIENSREMERTKNWTYPINQTYFLSKITIFFVFEVSCDVECVKRNTVLVALIWAYTNTQHMWFGVNGNI